MNPSFQKQPIKKKPKKNNKLNFFFPSYYLLLIIVPISTLPAGKPNRRLMTSSLPLNSHSNTIIHTLHSKPTNKNPSFSSPTFKKLSSVRACIPRASFSHRDTVFHTLRLKPRNTNSFCGGACSPRACSTSYPFIGKVGLHRREGNFNILSYGSSSDGGSTVVVKGDVSQVLSAALPVVVAVTAVAALTQPMTFTWVSKELYAPALGGIMLSIGIKLSIEDFALAFKRPLPLTVGFLAQYVLKPALGVFVARSFGMSPMYYAGFVLMSCVAGAQLSSYASFLSNGDVALSILLTSTSTIASVLVTPLLTGLLIGSVVPVDAVAMSKSILQVVLLPVTLGLALNTYAKPVASFLQPAMPFVAMFCTSICIGSPLAINRTQILSVEGLKLVWPVLTFHTVAFTFGYWISKLPFCRQDEEVSRTISLCTGMQSSTLAGLLATQFLGSSQAVPPACSVVAMAIMGLCLASFWGNGYRIRDLPYYLIPQTDSTISP